MTCGQLEKNLLLFLDPAGEMEEGGWRFVDWPKQRTRLQAFSTEGAASGPTIFSFDRGCFVSYLLFPLLAKLTGAHTLQRKILYLNDGLMSCFFDAGNAVGYRAYAASHVRRLPFLRQRLLSWLPLSLRAEKRYIVTAGPQWKSGASTVLLNNILAEIDFMFFSNPAGKVVLCAVETIRSGSGVIVKTTANPEYQRMMDKEYSTMQTISANTAKVKCLPRVGDRIAIRNRTYYSEEYIKGRTLLEVLHLLSLSQNFDGICLILDRLDEWFEDYLGHFTTAPKPVASCYHHLFQAFSSLYGVDRGQSGIMERAAMSVAEVAGAGGMVTTITAHNDLWPGNFVVRADTLVAVDWERAAEGRAPFFDYYWMMISATLVHLGCRAGASSFTRTFPLFCQGEDLVSRYAMGKIATFLERRGLNLQLHHNLMLLFLMELSVQGYIALGRQSELDGMAFAELVAFCREADARGGS